MRYIGISSYCDIKIVMVLYYSKYGAFSDIEILTIPKYTMNRFRSRMNQAKQRLHFCAHCKMRVFLASFVVKWWSKCKLVYLLLCFTATGNSALLSVAYTFETMTNTYYI